MSRWLRPLRGVGVAVTALAISACAGAPQAEGPASPGDTSWGPLAVVAPRQGAADGQFHGTLRMTEDCVFIEFESGETAVLLWPANWTTWNAESRTITFQQRNEAPTTVGDGDEVTLGGGASSVDEGRPTSQFLSDADWVSRPTPSCPLDVRVGVGAVMKGPPPTVEAETPG